MVKSRKETIKDVMDCLIQLPNIRSVSSYERLGLITIDENNELMVYELEPILRNGKIVI